ncbi:MAG TPA: autotransporter assembly complex family protein [Burkholderiales bacterium]|nr:autotransporter assembly complex family protein [Burkholderiales bacterium]
MRARLAAVLLLAALAFAGHARAASLEYRVAIDAPAPLAALLERGLSLMRWRDDPDMNAERLRRLVDDSVNEARETAATEGYFAARVSSTIDSSGEPWVVRLKVEPGERARVADVEIRFTGPISADGEARPVIARARQNWALRRGQPFRQEDWEAAKRDAVREVTSWRYASAHVGASEARVDPKTASVHLTVEIASGPPFRFGALDLSGGRRYHDALAANLAPFKPGDVYDRDKLVLYQQRLLESGYYASVQAEIDPNPALADAAPLHVSLLEANSQRVEGGVSYNTDVGARLEGRYGNMDIFDSAWRYRTGLRLDRKIQDLRFDFDSPPRPGGVWENYFAAANEQNIEGEVTRQLSTGVSHNFGAGPTPAALIVSGHTEDQRIGDVVADTRYAIYFGARGQLRRTDALVSPRRGFVVGVEVGGTPDMLSSRPFLRGVANATLFFPIGHSADLVLRGQAGAVLSNSREGIPSNFLFRTGGDQSVRGYAFESLGIAQDGAIVGGRRLLVGSAEYIFWITDSWGVATFVDAGNAWDSGVRPDLAKGYGVGGRFRTPIGPVRADIAYGEQTGEFRLHFSVGYSF